MKVEKQRLLYETHAWAGACAGLFLCILCVTGTAAVYRDEIRVWASPELWPLESASASRSGPTSADRALLTFSRRYDLTEQRLFALRLPGPDAPACELLIPAGGRPGVTRAFTDPITGVYLGEAHSELGDFLFQLHSNFSFASKIGRYFVGAAGLALLLLVTTGILIHTSLWRTRVGIRWSAKRRVVLSDWHKALGKWALPFHAVIAFTGTFLALKDLLILVPAAAAHGGNLGAARAALAEPLAVRTGASAEMASVDLMLARAKRHVPGFEPTLVVFQAWEDDAARVEVGGSLPGHLLPKNEAVRVTFDAKTGTPTRVERGTDHGAWRRIFHAMTPLHYGDYGGRPLRLLYFLLGIAGTALVWTGLMMWAERTKRPTRGLTRPSNRSTHRS